MTMENLQPATVAPAAQGATSKTAPSASNTTTTADAPAESSALPWVAALQAALMQQTKGLAPLPAQGAAAKDPADPADAAAPGTDDKRQTPADAAPAAAPTSMPLTLLATLAPIPPAPPATTPSTDRSDAQRALDSDALTTTAGAVNADPRPAADPRAGAEPRSADVHEATKAQHGTPDLAANADAMTGVIEHAAARDGNGRDANALPPVQFALAHAAPAAPPTATPHAAQLQVNAAVGSAAWGAEVGQKVVWMLGEKQHVAELRVNPPELGPLDIKLTVSEHQTTAVFTSPHGAVRDAVESAIPRLREVLAESGIMLGNASVTSDSPRDGSAFSAPNDRAHHGRANSGAPESVSAGTQPAAGMPVRRNGLVDLFA
jgi:flagellar hook-length control protein FliK